jgi:hypothetical protein
MRTIRIFMVASVPVAIDESRTRARARGGERAHSGGTRGFGAEGDLVVLHQKKTSVLTIPEKSADELLGWPLRKTSLQRRVAQA